MAYKKNELPKLRKYSAQKAARVRRRRVAGVALIVGFLLVVVAVTDYLIGGDETSQSGGDPAAVEQAGGTPLAEERSQSAGGATETAGTMEVLGAYRTDFTWDTNPNRQENMRTAAGAIDNTVVKPGEVFSFNELTASLEYAEAKTFSDGGIGYTDGGGLCQVSSTLYMAANYAGLEIVERHPHYAVLSYIKPGFDATVWFGGEGIEPLDMKFENTTDGDILIREWVDEDGFLNAEILGQPTGKKVSMSSEKYYEGSEGIKYITYKTMTQGDETLFDGVLYRDVYGYNPPVPEGVPSYEVNTPRVGGWPDPTNTTGWADPH